MSIALKIFAPDEQSFTATAERVVLPIQNGTLTIIERRAPRSEILVQGDVILLDKDNHPCQKIQINGGMAEIAQDICLIATEHFTCDTSV